MQHYWKSSLWIIFLFALWACEQQGVESLVGAEREENDHITSTSFRITSQSSERDEMPFTVTNMQKAYLSLVSNPTVPNREQLSPKLAIQPTHFYCVFTPPDSQSVDALFADPLLDVTEEPLSHKDDTFEPLLPDNGVSIFDDKDDNYFNSEDMVYYATVPVGYKLPNVPYTILEYFYFPPEDLTEGDKGPTSSILALHSTSIMEMLEMESMKLTYNLEEEDMLGLEFIGTQNNNISLTQAVNSGLNTGELHIDYSNFVAASSSQRRRRWTAEGTLTFEEDVFSGPERVQPLMGALVKVRKWGFLVIGQGYTNRDGYYYAGRPRTKYVKYSVYFENRDEEFSVRAGSRFVQAKHRDRQRYKRQGYNKYFASGDRKHFHAMICNAAFDYMNRAVSHYQLFDPKDGRDVIPLVAKFTRDVSSQFTGDALVAPYIRISRIRQGSYRGSDGVYATTVHELTHAGHYEHDTGFFISLHSGFKDRKVMRESWAEGVETKLTNDRYLAINSAYLATNRTHSSDVIWNDWRQRTLANDMGKYTPLVIDLMDDIDQSLNLLFTNRPQDRVESYTLNQIQGALNNSRTIDEWQNKLFGRYPNLTRGVLNDVFNYARASADRLRDE